MGAAFVALYVSYGHLQDVLAAYGYDIVSSHAGPVAIDVTMAMATLALNRVGQKRRVLDVSKPVPMSRAIVPADTKDATTMSEPYVATVEDVRQSEEAFAGDVSDMSSASIWDRLDTIKDTKDSTLPVPVSPAPSVRTSPDRIPGPVVQLLMAWHRAPVYDRPAPSDVDKLLASEAGKSTKTIYRWRKETEPQLGRWS
jgi:hypothetical protein